MAAVVVVITTTMLVMAEAVAVILWGEMVLVEVLVLVQKWQLRVAEQRSLNGFLQ